MEGQYDTKKDIYRKMIDKIKRKFGEEEFIPIIIRQFGQENGLMRRKILRKNTLKKSHIFMYV